VKPLLLRTRLTAWYSFVLAVILVVFALTITWQQSAIGMRRVDRELVGLTGTLASLLGDELAESDTPVQAATEVVQTLAAAGRTVTIATGEGQVLAAAPGAPSPATGTRRADAVWAETSLDGRWRVSGKRQAIAGQMYLLLAAAPTADGQRERRETAEAMWLGIPLLLLLAAAGGSWLAAVALRPMTAMAARAAALRVDGADDLGRSGREDELGQFERAFNGVLARLRAALGTQRQFMADASHELRTPVSVMRSVADVTLDRLHRDEHEYREALAVVGAQTQLAARVLDDMLMLARADAGGYPLRRESLYLNELLHECVTSLGGLAHERGVTLRMSDAPDTPAVGDDDLLRRMVLNLLQNAVQHTRSGGAVEVALMPVPDGVEIVVTDQGPGIPEVDRVRIFDRFVQLDSARRRAGAGLGLPISRWIAEAHGGRLGLRASSSAGSVFVASLPRSAA